MGPQCMLSEYILSDKVPLQTSTIVVDFSSCISKDVTTYISQKKANFYTQHIFLATQENEFTLFGKLPLQTSVAPINWVLVIDFSSCVLIDVTAYISKNKANFYIQHLYSSYTRKWQDTTQILGHRGSVDCRVTCLWWKGDMSKDRYHNELKSCYRG